MSSNRFRYERHYEQSEELTLRPQPDDLFRGDLRNNIGDYRSPARRDRDRLYYSQSFQRLSDVTQLLHSGPGLGLLHNRMTHSLKVAQVARSLAERFNDPLFVDPDAADAAGLAHDVGHPPYGHVGEQVLDRLLRERGLDGYEGNAQAFRVLTKLATHHPVDPGLNLTRVTLAGAMKYPFLGDPSEKSIYASEEADYKFARAGLEAGEPTAEAVVVDLADDISYALHDLDDFYRAHLLRLPDFMHADVIGLYDSVYRRGTVSAVFRENFEEGIWVEAYENLVTLLSSRENSALLQEYDGSRLHQGLLRALTSRLISRWLDGVERSAGRVTVDQIVGCEVTLLKEFVYQSIIAGRPATAQSQRRERLRVDQAFIAAVDLVPSEPWSRLPEKLRFMLETGIDEAERTGSSMSYDSTVHRAVADFVSQLTETELEDMVRDLR